MGGARRLDLCFAVLFSVALAGSTGCQARPQLAVGAPCEKADQCGKGRDCYQGKCRVVCSTAEPCAGNFTCEAHRCVPAKTTATSATSQDGNGIVDRPELPDPVAAELRAIRVELEKLSHQQEKILERLDAAKR